MSDVFIHVLRIRIHKHACRGALAYFAFAFVVLGWNLSMQQCTALSMLLWERGRKSTKQVTVRLAGTSSLHREPVGHEDVMSQPKQGGELVPIHLSHSPWKKSSLMSYPAEANQSTKCTHLPISEQFSKEHFLSLDKYCSKTRLRRLTAQFAFFTHTEMDPCIPSGM